MNNLSLMSAGKREPHRMAAVGPMVTQYFPFSKDFCCEHGKTSGLTSTALNYAVIYWPL